MNKQELQEKYRKPKGPHEWRGASLPSRLVSTFFGAGMLPKMPGTWGSLAAAALAYPMALCTIWFLPAALIIFFGAIPFVNRAMRDTKTEDPGWIVIDEVCGQWADLAFVPPALIVERPWLLVVAFALFRLFDILKPLGIHRFEKFPQGWGVMADDLLGGLYAGILMAALAAVL